MFYTEYGYGHRARAVHEGRCEGERYQGTRRGQYSDARERWDHGAPHRKEAGNEDAVGPVPLVLRLDMREHRGREQPPAGGSIEEVASVASCQPVHGGRRRDVRHPREYEDRPEVEPAPPREERAERHG